MKGKRGRRQKNCDDTNDRGATMASRAKDEAEGLRHMSWISTPVPGIGPADLEKGPLTGTRYDPAYRDQQHREHERETQDKIRRREAQHPES